MIMLQLLLCVARGFVADSQGSLASAGESNLSVTPLLTEGVTLPVSAICGHLSMFCALRWLNVENVRLDALLRMCPPGVQGLNAKDLIQMARAYDCRACVVEFRNLSALSEAVFPVILWVDAVGDAQIPSHYVCLLARAKEGWWIMDNGHLECLSDDALSNRWSGVAIIVVQTSWIEEGNRIVGISLIVGGLAVTAVGIIRKVNGARHRVGI